MFGSVINRVRQAFLERSIGKLLRMRRREIGIELEPVLGMIPEDLNILKAVEAKKPVTSYKPRSRSSKSFEKIAKSILRAK
jgi:MinD-like ATPase involved in chromosome partitioning or flagellar assembly